MYRLILLISILFMGCQPHNIYLKCEVKNVELAPTFKGLGLQKVICYDYTFDGKKYKQRSELGHILVDVGDTVKISFNSKNPDRVKVLSVIRRVSAQESKDVYKERSERIFSYHRVEEKPLFFNAESFAENDSLVNHFIFEGFREEDVKVTGKVSVYLTIKADGEVFIRKISSNDLDFEILVAERIKKMPKWRPGKNKGEFVNVSFLIDLSKE